MMNNFHINQNERLASEVLHEINLSLSRLAFISARNDGALDDAIKALKGVQDDVLLFSLINAGYKGE